MSQVLLLLLLPLLVSALAVQTSPQPLATIKVLARVAVPPGIVHERVGEMKRVVCTILNSTETATTGRINVEIRRVACDDEDDTQADISMAMVMAMTNGAGESKN